EKKMKERKKSLQKRKSGTRCLVLAVLVAMLFFLLHLTVLTLKKAGENGGNSTPITFDDKGILFDGKTKVEVLVGDEVTEMTLSDYLIGVVSAEMPALYPKEALKAQAIAARTYVIYRKTIREERPASASHENADVCTNSAHCQAYATPEKREEKWGEHSEEYLALIRAAVEETDGEIVAYRGKPISAVFHALSSGATESAEDVWGYEIPYLQSVESPWDREHEKFETAVTLETGEFKEIFLAKYPDARFPENPEGWIESVTRSAAGGIRELTVGGVTLSGRAFRNLYGLRSAHIDFSFGSGEITMTVRGFGHGVGMSQYGARGMALEGKTAEEILAWYYSGTEIETLKAW
ncbi:MAG: stage II sporulation protein D, partial [Clostridia bacterium]|nr:stage II sporulation protein D [Clostridia bacterium]